MPSYRYDSEENGSGLRIKKEMNVKRFKDVILRCQSKNLKFATDCN